MQLHTIIAVILTWAKIVISINHNVLYVLPNNSSSASCPSHPCATLSQYQQNDGTLSIVSNVQYHLLPGEHYVPANMILINLYNFTLIGINGENLSPVVLINCLQSFIQIFHSQLVTISNVVFKQCDIPLKYKYSYGNETNLIMAFCMTCTIHNATFSEYGLLGFNMIGNSSLNQLVINLTISNPISYLTCRGIYLQYESLYRNNRDHHSITINGAYVNGICNQYLQDEGYADTTTATLIVSYQYIDYDLSVVVSNSHFHGIRQKAIAVINVCSHTDTVILIINCVFDFNTFHFKTFYNSMIGLTLSKFNTLVRISNCSFNDNRRYSHLIVIGELDQCSLPIINSKFLFPNTIYIKACNFIKNKNPILMIRGEQDLARYKLVVFLLGSINISETFCKNDGLNIIDVVNIRCAAIVINGTIIVSRNNVENIMVFEECNITFANAITFHSNTCTQIITLTSGTAYVNVMQNSILLFANNHFFNDIIVIVSDNYNVPVPYCVFQYATQNRINVNGTISSVNYNIIFDENINALATSKKCKKTFHHFTSHCKWTSMSVFQGYDPGVINQMIIQSNDQQISEHTTICHCPNNFTSNCTSDILGPVYPGQTLCSGDDATLYTDTHNALLPPSACRIAHQYQLITFITSHFQIVNFTIVSDANDVCELFLTASPNLYKIYEIFYVKLLPCPIGFVLKNGTCDCDPTLKNRHIHIDTCYIDQSTIRRPDNSWIIHIQSNKMKYLLCKNCPMDYCLPQSSNVNLENPDMQCQFNRTGILCSQCQHSLSMVFGSSRCVHCTNVHLLVSVIVLVAGIVLVTLLYILNLTVTTGTINGIIFYANIININDSVFLVNDNVFKPLRLFVSWVNLDFGIETCFYDGMGGYAKFFLKLFFPLYVIITAILIIISSRFSSKILRWTYSKSFPVLATVFLLSYTSVFRTVITALFTYSTITELPSGHQQLVWSIDASVPLFGVKFIMLFITCLVIFLFLLIFNIILLFTRLLSSKFVVISCLKLLNDAFQGSFKEKYHYWIGGTILFRSLFFVLNAFQPQTKLIMSAVIMMSIGLLFGSIHPNRNKLVNIQELILLLNLAIIYTVSYQGSSKVFFTITNVMISLSLIQLFVIIFYHFLTYTFHCNPLKVLQTAINMQKTQSK